MSLIGPEIYVTTLVVLFHLEQVHKMCVPKLTTLSTIVMKNKKNRTLIHCRNTCLTGLESNIYKLCNCITR